MVNFFVSFLFIIVFSVSVHGWGNLVSRICYRDNKTRVAYNCTLGIAVLVIVGGFLNIFQIAYPIALHLLLYGGVILTVIPLARHFQSSFKGDNPVRIRGDRKARLNKSSQSAPGILSMNNFLFAVTILVPFIFLVYNLMPTTSFNAHDDFQVYFVRPFRMLQTGTVGGDPFDLLGLDSLGSLSFIQAFTLLWLDARHLNGFDAVICFLLCIGLIIEVGKELKAQTIFILSAVALFILINSQYANISSIYSGSLMLLGIVYSYVIIDARGAQLKESLRISILASLPVAFLFVSLLSFKMTYFFITVLFIITNILLTIALNPDNKKSLQLNIFCAFFIVLMITPWVLIHLKNYLNLVHNFLGDFSLTSEISTGTFNNQIKLMVTEENREVISELLSTNELLYLGNTYRDYLLAIVMLFVTGLAAASYVWRNKSNMLVPFISLLLLVVVNCYILSRLFPARLVIRYSCPVIIALLPMSVLLVGHIVRNEIFFWRDFFPSKVVLAVCCFLLVWQVVVGVAFGPTFVERVKRVVNYRTLLAYPAAMRDDYINYNRLILSDTGKQKMLSHQNEVKPGLKILAWITAPFWLDFSRNRLFIVNNAGLQNDWLKLPLSGGPSALLEYFRKQEIDNFIWEIKGKGMKYRAASSLLAETMFPMAQKSRILFDDGGTVVFNTLQQ